MPINQSQADAAIGSGIAFDLLDRLVYTGISELAIEDRLIRRFGGPGTMDRDTAGYILRRYTLFRNAGLRIDQRNDNSTAGQQFLPRVPGCSGNFEYTTVQTFHDPTEDRTFTKRFIIASDVMLGKRDIQTAAREAGVSWLGNPDSLPGSVGEVSSVYMLGQARVTAAARCTP